MSNFIHLHVHSDFSIGDGICKPKEIVQKAKELNQPAIALTDHGNACGLYDFWKECKNLNVKPICGAEIYCANNIKIEDDEGKIKKDRTYHCVLLAKNNEGYKDICRLLYKSYKYNFYYRPTVLFDELFSITPGNIIITTACIGGILNKYFLENKDDLAYEVASKFKAFFKDDFYTEIQINELEQQKICNEKILKLSKNLNIKTIITNDVHYIDKDDAKFQDALKLIIFKRTKKEIEENPESSPFLTARRNYLCSFDELLNLNKEFNYNISTETLSEFANNTMEISEKCNFDFDVTTKKFPKIQVPSQYENISSYFRKLCFDGLNEKISLGIIKEENRKIYEDRLNYEIKIISDAEYCDYFLIFKDIFDYARKNNIFTGPSRGSAGGCLVSYVLKITKVDPIKHDLMFERFINPTRIIIPDIDSDFDADRKNEIEIYLKQKYGEDSVFPVSTFNEFHLRGILRDLCRVFDRGIEDVSNLTKVIDEDVPLQYNNNIEEYFNSLKEEKKEVEIFINKNKDLIEYAKKLYGKIRYNGKHAAGIVVFDGSIAEHIPVIKLKGELLTGFSEGTTKKHLSDLKYLKLDILGLDTISIIKDTIKLIEKTKNKNILNEIENIDLSDENLFKTIRDYENSGIFQMDGYSINKLCKAIQPNSFEDVVAISSLHRPGSLQSGLAFTYAESKNNIKKINVPKIFQKYVEKTYGVIIYQEQLIQCISECLGISIGEADKWRKVFGNGFRDEWIDGIDINNIEKERKERPKLNEFIEKYEEKIKITHPELSSYETKEALYYLLSFNGYLFNRSHALSYGIITMQCLFLKTYYPTEFYCVLISRTSDEDKIKKYIISAKNKGINILPFSIKKSKYNCSIEGEKNIRLGFKLAKGFGIKAWEELKEHQHEIKDFETFFSIKWHKLNKKCIELLCGIGAFDDFGYKRKNVHEFITNMLENMKATKKNKIDEKLIYSKLKQNNIIDFTEREKAKFYKEYLGFNLNSVYDEKLSKMKDLFKKNNIISFSEFSNSPQILGGIIEEVNEKLTKNKKIYYEIIINDGNQKEKVKIWPWKCNDFNYNDLQENNIIIITLDKDEKWGFSNSYNGIIKII